MKRWIALLCVIALLLCTLAFVGCKGDDELPENEQSESETPGGETSDGGASGGSGGPKGEKDPTVSDNFQ